MRIRTSTVTRFAYVSAQLVVFVSILFTSHSLLDISQGQHAWAGVFAKLLTICDREACRRLVWVQLVTMSRGVYLERSHI
jgi:hypothetical protein